MPITPPPSRGASSCNTLLSSLFVCRELHKFLLALHWSQLATSWSAVDIPWRYISSYHYAFKSWVYCVHTQTSQHIKHMFTIHKASSLPEKSVLVWGLSLPPPTQLSEDLNSVYLYNYYQEGSNTGHLVAGAGAQYIHNRWENWNVHNILCE